MRSPRFLLKDLKIGAAFNYKPGTSALNSLISLLKGWMPYLDPVGGEIQDIAISKFKYYEHVIAIGKISTIKGAKPYVTKNLGLFIGNALQINGFTVFEHVHRLDGFWEATKPLVVSGQVKTHDSIVEGAEKLP